MSSFSYDPVWTQNHGFTIGTEVNFSLINDAADSLTNIPFSIGGLWVFGGNINYNAGVGGSGETTLLLRLAICGDPAGGDAGGGPGSLVLVNRALYVRGGENVCENISSFAVGLDNRYLPVPPDGSPYQMHMRAEIRGAVANSHLEFSLCGMWR